MRVKTQTSCVRTARLKYTFRLITAVRKNSPAPDLFRLGIGVALARYYSDSIRDNVKRRFEQKAERWRVAGKAPIG